MILSQGYLGRGLFDTICCDRRMTTVLGLFLIVVLRGRSFMMMATLMALSSVRVLLGSLPTLLKTALYRAFRGSEHTNRA